MSTFGCLRQSFSEQWRSYLSELEVIHVRGLLEQPDGPMFHRGSVLAIEQYPGLDTEMQLIANRRYEGCVMVGCGAYPETLIVIGENENISGKIHGLERDGRMAALAACVLDRCVGRERQRRASIQCGDGAAYNYSGYDLVVDRKS